MDPKLLSHLLQLAAKTGDRLIIIDPTTQQPFVLMGLAQYEGLIASTNTIKTSSMASVAAPFVPDRSSVENESFTSLPAEAAEAFGNAMGAVGGFSPEPMNAVPQEEDRFYVEPLE